MARWQIEYGIENAGKDQIEKWFDNLSAEELKSVSKEVKMLAVAGNDLRLRHSRALGGGLFELRERRFNFRIYYCFAEEDTIFLLAAGNKQSQTKDIKLARERLGAL
jgi:putative addiction module killer protein